LICEGFNLLFLFLPFPFWVTNVKLPSTFSDGCCDESGISPMLLWGRVSYLGMATARAGLFCAFGCFISDGIDCLFSAFKHARIFVSTDAIRAPISG
jgi:hypothetical protein